MGVSQRFGLPPPPNHPNVNYVFFSLCFGKPWVSRVHGLRLPSSHVAASASGAKADAFLSWNPKGGTANNDGLFRA